VRQFTVREIQGRYRGSHLGLLWALLQPLVGLAIYTFVFGVVFQARWPESRSAGLAEFSVTLFAGLVVFNIFSECMNRAPGLVVAVPNYVKKVVFPLEILPLAVLGASLFHAAIAAAVLVVAQVALVGPLPPTAWFAPLVLVPLVLLTLGLSWFLAALGVFFRDLQQAMGLALMALFFCTPIFYGTSAVPAALRPALLANPLAPIVEAFRSLLLWGRLPAAGPLAAWTVAGAAVFLGGYAFFRRLRPGFADVI
jgi:lipopolysaccharide transport system permease protein